MAEQLVWARVGAQVNLDQIRQSIQNWYNALVRLYTNNYTPVWTSTIANFTEATFSGYAGILNGTWNPAFFNGVDVPQINRNTLTWTFTGGASQSIYGWYIKDQTNTFLYCAARFDPAPQVLTNPGDTVVITPSITMDSLHH